MGLLITGAASGIGRHLVGAFARGADARRVIATDLSHARLTEVAAADGWPATVELAALDVCDPQAWQVVWDAAEARGPIDVVMNVAGFLAPDWIEHARDADIDRHIDVNVKGVVYGTRCAARAMIARRSAGSASAGVSGHIINVGSLASLSPVPGLSLYAASKFAVRGFSLSVALELADKGVAVTVVMPDAVQTPMLDIQKPRAEAALTFSGGKVLTPHDIELAMREVLRTRPLELAIPTSRGVLARVASAMPGLGQRLLPLMRALGRKRQARHEGQARHERPT